MKGYEGYHKASYGMASHLMKKFFLKEPVSKGQ